MKFVADRAGAYWLLAQKFDNCVAAEAFQLWGLTVKRDSCKGTLACDDGNGTIVIRKEIEYTDHTLPEVKLYLADNTILLPSEY